ncbi:N-acetylglucosamine kinase [Brevibacillus sp. TJ4]|uniref:N-acetylglucosamine kinase n=1 Tax=Brevibacillus sp. TJ4 TaxID=3234853 RepID=UPI0037D59D7D
MRSNKQSRWFIGIDGGGTRTRGAICDEAGRVAAIAVGDGSNALSRPWSEVERTLRQLIDELIQSAGTSRDQVEALYLGLAGADRPAIMQLLTDAFAEEWQERLHLDNDAVAALYAGTWGKPGIVLIAGTGSIAYGINSRGERYRVGGWGYLVGDEGSGFDLGRQAVSAALRAFDGRAEPTALSQLLLAHYAVQTVPELIAILYGSGNPRKELASLSSLAETAARGGDAVARQLVRQAAAELAGLAAACQQKMGESLPVVLAGGLLTTDTLVRQELLHIAEFHVCQPVVTPVTGALAAALERAGALLDEKVIRQLQMNEAWKGSYVDE